MRLLRALLRPGPFLAGLALLAALAAGEVADTFHHLSDQGCAADTGSGARDEHCTCAGLHAAPLAGHAPAPLASVVQAQAYATVVPQAAPLRHREAEASPRAPPRS